MLQAHFIGPEQRCATTAAKTHQHARLGQLAHGGLGDGGARAQQDAGGVGDGDVPVQAALARIGHVFHPATVDENAAVFQVIQIRPCGMQHLLEV